MSVVSLNTSETARRSFPGSKMRIFQKILVVLSGFTFGISGLVALSETTAYAADSCENPSDGIAFSPGVETVTPVNVDQQGVKGQILAGIRKWRQDALNTGVKWPAKDSATTVKQYLAQEGISESDYLNPQWSYGLERIALQRAVEARRYEDGHTRPDGTQWHTATFNGVSSNSENLAWGYATATAAVDGWASEKKDWLDLSSSGVTGHYEMLLNPDILSYGAGRSDESPEYSYSWAMEGTLDRQTDERATDWSGQCNFTVRFPASVLTVSHLNLAAGESKAPAVAVSLPEGTQASYDVKIASLALANTDIATIDGTKITGKKAGTTTYTVTSGTVSKTANLTVVADTIASVNPPAAVTTVSGTAPVLPKQVNVTYGSGKTGTAAVTWEAVDKSKYAARQGGTFTVSGTVTGWNTPVTVTVNVTPATITALTDATVTTAAGVAPQLPAKVNATWSNGDTTQEAVTWDLVAPASYAQEGQTFTVSGTAANTSIKAKVNVTVGQPQPLAAQSVTVETIATNAPALPQSVRVTWSNGTTTDQPVTWQTAPEASYAQAGRFKVAGTTTVNGKTLNTEATVNVIARSISKAVQVNATTASGQAPTLPKSVDVTWNDGKTTSETITWKSIDRADYTARNGGTRTLADAGTVNGNTPVALALTITAAIPLSAASSEVTTVAGVAPTMPKATVTWSDGDPTTVAEVTWDSVEAAQFAKAGEFSVDGTVNVNGISLDVSTRVHVVEATMTAVADLAEVTTESGAAPVLPAVLTATWSNNSTSNVAVEWNKVTAEQYSTVKGGTFTVSGSVAGWDKPVKVTVTVKPATALTAQNPDAVTTESGEAPALPATAKVTWSNGQTTDEQITWDKLDSADYSARAGGEFEATGSVQGLPVTVEVTVKPAKVIGIQVFADVVTMSGEVPRLPAQGVIGWTNGDTEQVDVTWDKVAPASYAKAGTFTVNGTVTYQDKTYSVSVTIVVAASETTTPTSAATASVLKKGPVIAQTGFGGSGAIPVAVMMLVGGVTALAWRRKTR